MKYIVILGDGMADYPLDELNGKTPLDVAVKPNIDNFAKKGIVGKYGNANITIENLLAKDDTSVYNQLRTEHAVAFAEQINKVEPYRPQDAFEDALKGLYLFGGLVTRPEEIVVLKTNI